MTEQEKQEIINAVLSAIRTNSNTINQLTPVTELSDDDSIEISGGKRVTYGVLMGLIETAYTSALSNYVSNSTFTHDMTVLETALREAMSNIADTLSGMVINDLVTGGEEVALSAEMGKELNERLEEIEESGTGGIGISISGTKLIFTSSGDISDKTPSLIVNKESINVGQVEQGKSKAGTFTVRGKNLIGAISINSNNAKVTVSPSNLQPANGSVQTTEITVTCTPTALGSGSAVLTITSDDAETKTINITYECVEQRVPTIEVSENSITLKGPLSTDNDSTPGTAKFTVRGLNLTGNIDLALSNNSAFSVNVNSLTPVGEDVEETEITVYLAKQAATGTVTDDLVISSQGAEQVTIALTGLTAQRKTEGTIYTDNVQGIEYKFKDNTNIIYADPASLKVINVTISSVITDDYGYLYGVTCIRQFSSVPTAFRSTIKSITLQEGIIGMINTSSLFNGCSGMEDMVLPDSFLSDGDYFGTNAFVGCSSLKSITFGKNFKAWPNGMCNNGCVSLEDIYWRNDSALPRLESGNVSSRFPAIEDENAPNGKYIGRVENGQNVYITLHLPKSKENDWGATTAFDGVFQQGLKSFHDVVFDIED